MSRKRPADLTTVQAGLDEIAGLLKRRPELRERAVKFFSGEMPGLEMEEAMGRDMRPLTIRLPTDLLEKAGDLAVRLQAHREEIDPLAVGSRQATTADLVRAALMKGIAVLERELPKVSPRKKRAATRPP